MLPTSGSSHTSEVNTIEIKNSKTDIITTPSQVVAEATEETQEEIRSSSRAREAEEGDVEVVGEADLERPHDVHGADPGQGRPADTDNRNRNPFVHIEAHTKPVLAEYTHENLNLKTRSVISNITKPNESTESTGELKHNLITGESNDKNQNNLALGNLEINIEVIGNSQKLKTVIAEGKNDNKDNISTLTNP